jgi:hypothetical protein
MLILFFFLHQLIVVIIVLFQIVFVQIAQNNLDSPVVLQTSESAVAKIQGFDAPARNIQVFQDVHHLHEQVCEEFTSLTECSSDRTSQDVSRQNVRR